LKNKIFYNQIFFFGKENYFFRIFFSEKVNFGKKFFFYKKIFFEKKKRPPLIFSLYSRIKVVLKKNQLIYSELQKIAKFVFALSSS
jgi:hypothetical protein